MLDAARNGTMAPPPPPPAPAGPLACAVATMVAVSPGSVLEGHGAAQVLKPRALRGRHVERDQAPRAPDDQHGQENVQGVYRRKMGVHSGASPGPRIPL